MFRCHENECFSLEGGKLDLNSVFLLFMREFLCAEETFSPPNDSQGGPEHTAGIRTGITSLLGCLGLQLGDGRGEPKRSCLS